MNTRSLFKPSLIITLVAATLSTPRPKISEAEPVNPFRAACVKVDITPETPQWLHGYGPRKSDGIHDHIFHRILCMDDGNTRFFLVSTDVCTISPAYYEQVCKRLEKETGVKPEQVWWATTHTHSAPHLGPQYLAQLFIKSLGDRFSIDDDVQYWKWVEDRLIEGIQQAVSQLEPAKLGVGTGVSYANINRRGWSADGRSILGVAPEAPVDRQIGLLRLERPDGSPIALVANYAIHGTVLGGRNPKISGDVPGIVAEYVESRVGAPMLFINGAEGNVAPIYSVRADFAHSHIDEFKSLLGNRILEANRSIDNSTSEVRLALGKTVILTPRKEDLGWREELADYTESSEGGKNLVRIPVYSLTINKDTVLYAAPLELFCEIAMEIRKASPFRNTFYCGLTNGSLLYLPTSGAFEGGGYEPSVSVFTPQAQQDFTEGVLQHLRELSPG